MDTRHIFSEYMLQQKTKQLLLAGNYRRIYKKEKIFRNTIQLLINNTVIIMTQTILK